MAANPKQIGKVIMTSEGIVYDGKVRAIFEQSFREFYNMYAQAGVMTIKDSGNNDIISKGNFVSFKENWRYTRDGSLYLPDRESFLKTWNDIKDIGGQIELSNGHCLIASIFLYSKTLEYLLKYLKTNRTLDREFLVDCTSWLEANA